MSRLQDEIIREAAQKGLRKLTETRAGYVLESCLGYPPLERRNCPDLQCKIESIGVDVTSCDENKIFSWLRDIAAGHIFPDNAKKSEARLFNYMCKKKLGRTQLYAFMPQNGFWETISDEQKEFCIQKAKKLIRVRASSIVMCGNNSQERLMSAIAQTVDKKMRKLPKYKQFDRMELFISLQPFALEDSSDVPLIHELLQEHVFAKTPCFGAVHILIGSAETQSMILFTFTENDVQKTKVSFLIAGKKAFKQYNAQDPRDPQRVLDKLNELDRRVDEKICGVLRENYPDSAWDELWEELQGKYQKNKEEKPTDGYPEGIIRLLRSCKWLDEDDTHLDDYFQSMSPSHVFSKVLEYNGLLVDWDYTIKGWIKDIYDIDLDAVENRSQTD